MRVKNIDIKTKKETVLRTDENQYLSFVQGNELFALPIDSVCEVLDVATITPVPLVPSYIRGVLNLRGTILPVIDFAARLGHTSASIKKFTTIINIEVKDGNDTIIVGLMVDQVKEVLGLRSEDIDETPDFGTTIRTDFISGVGKKDNGYIILINVATLLNISELADFVL